MARELLGAVVVCGECSGRIVEVEAYLGLEDPAAHAYRGMTERTRVIFGPPGRAYVYFIYGMYDCLNFVAISAGCVLIRALEPVSGMEEMFGRRPAAKRVEQLCSGPGKLTRAMGITRALNGHDVTRRGECYVTRGRRPSEILAGPRIGISKNVEPELRFWQAGSAFVSR